MSKQKSDTLIWDVRGKSYKCQILPQPCTKCDKPALVGLPLPILERQPDKTNVVCLPALGGCNHGFHLDVPDGCLSCEWELHK